MDTNLPNQQPHIEHYQPMNGFKPQIIVDKPKTAYLMEIDGDPTIVIADNISEAMDKAAEVSTISSSMIAHSSYQVLF